VFLSGTLLNAAAVVVGTTIGLLAGRAVPARVHDGLTTGLGLFVLVLSTVMAASVFTDPAHRQGDELAVLAGVLSGVAIGEAFRLHDRLEALGAWLQARLSRPGSDASVVAPTAARPGEIAPGPQPASRVAEAFVTASLVFCVGPLTILGSLENGLRGDASLLAVKSLLDGVASIAFAAALGAGVYLSVATILLVQGGIAAAAFLVTDALDPRTVLVVTSAGGVALLGVGLRLLDLKAVRVANFLPALVLAPLFLRLFDAIRALL
jgi:uncharacterized membrane protein YqgA involved in biofilm formation